MVEKRAFIRHAYRAYGTLLIVQGSDSDESPAESVNMDSWPRFPAHVLNISYKGALIAVLEDHDLQSGQTIKLHLEMESGENVWMSGKVAHTKDHFIGLACKPSDEEDTRNLAELLINTQVRD